jgi:exodeoxyribonuclease V alpha subunit
MPLCSGMKKMLYRNLLYTGVTRAKEKLVIAGDRHTVASMVDRNKKTSRSTSIRYFLDKMRRADKDAS